MGGDTVPGDVRDHGKEQDHDEEDGDATGCSDQLPNRQPDGHHGERVRVAIWTQETCHKSLVTRGRSDVCCGDGESCT